MKDIYTLIAYKASGSYGGCLRGCCRASYYDGALSIIVDDDFDRIIDRAFNIHKSNRLIDEHGNGNDFKPEGYYEFLILLNGLQAVSFCFDNENRSGLEICDMTSYDDTTDEYWEFEKKKSEIDQKIQDKIKELEEEIKTLKNPKKEKEIVGGYL